MKFVIQWYPICGIHLHKFGRDWHYNRQTDRRLTGKNFWRAIGFALGWIEGLNLGQIFSSPWPQILLCLLWVPFGSYPLELQELWGKLPDFPWLRENICRWCVSLWSLLCEDLLWEIAFYMRLTKVRALLGRVQIINRQKVIHLDLHLDCYNMSLPSFKIFMLLNHKQISQSSGEVKYEK